MKRIWNNWKNWAAWSSARPNKPTARVARAVRQAVMIEGLEGRTLMSAAPLSVTEVPFDGGTQLQVTAGVGGSEIAVSQTAAGLVVSDGAGWAQTFSPNGGPFKQIVARAGSGNYSVLLDPSVTVDAVLYAGSGNDTLSAGSGDDILYSGSGSATLKAGAGNDTLVALNGSRNVLVGGPGTDVFWVDARGGNTVTGVTPAESADGSVHQVGAFLGTGPAGPSAPTASGPKAGAASAGQIKPAKPAKLPKAKPVHKAPAPKPAKVVKPKKGTIVTPTAPAAQDNLMTAAPVDPKVTSDASGYKNYASAEHPLFGDGGPTADDVVQGAVGDCYFLATLASVAKIDPALIRRSVVDLGDGTYAVAFHHNGSAVYVRVNADLPAAPWGSLAYADFGHQGAMWVAVMEKAYTFFRNGGASYKSIDAGWMDEAYSALGSSSQSTYSASGPQSLVNLLATQLAAGKSVTMAFSTASDGADLITGHAYTVVAVNADAAGKPSTVTVRNPWGVTDSGGSGNGYVTLTAQQVFDSLLGFVSAYV